MSLTISPNLRPQGVCLVSCLCIRWWLHATRPRQSAWPSGLTAYRNAEYLNTLSVAYAAVGRLPDAVKRAQQALRIAEQDGNDSLANTLRGKLERIQKNRSVRP